MLQVFNYNNQQVRTIDIDGEPWFVAKDVAEILGYENPTKAIRDHVDDVDKQMGVQNVTPSIQDNLGREQYPTWINECGLYSLVMSSKLPGARQFRRWVYAEVLPSIRKHGVYATPAIAKQMLADPDFIREVFIELEAERQAKAKLQEQMTLMEPKATYCDKVLHSPELVSTTVIAKDYGMSAVRFNKLLHEKGIQYKQGKTWFLYSKYDGLGYTASDTFHYVDGKTGEDGSRVSMKWTQKGRMFLYSFLKEQDILPVMEREAA